MSANPMPQDDSAPLVLRQDNQAVCTLTLNRGSRANALSRSMVRAMAQMIDEIAADPGVRVVVLAASGRAFCAGHDMRELQQHRDDTGWLQGLFDECSQMMQALTRMPQPVIARVHGIATAAGCQLVSMCDLAVAASEARFALPGVNVGIFCTTPAVGVARSVLRKPTLEMLLTGEPIDAATARERGLINRVVNATELDAEVERLAGLIASRSGALIAAGKRAFYRQVELSMADAYALAGGEMVSALGLDDASEGIDAFLTKRPAHWTHQ